jgi:TRAP-type mannitol/chloroaromatic compound transport system permease small subunit
MIVLGAVLSVPAVALLTFLYLQRMVASEYASGERVSTNGDSLGIPVIEVTVVWTSLLLLSGAVYFAVRFIRWALRNDAG